MVEDLTPEHLKCGSFSSCPSVHRIEPVDLTPENLRCGAGASRSSVTAVAGDLLIVGKRADQIAQDLGKGVGPDEYAISIHPDYLSGIPMVARLREENEKLRAALKPFAAIKPSSFYPPDGSEGEGYVTTLWEKIHALGNSNPKPDFTGADLVHARAVLASSGEADG